MEVICFFDIRRLDNATWSSDLFKNLIGVSMLVNINQKVEISCPPIRIQDFGGKTYVKSFSGPSGVTEAPELLGCLENRVSQNISYVTVKPQFQVASACSPSEIALAKISENNVESRQLFFLEDAQKCVPRCSNLG